MAHTFLAIPLHVNKISEVRLKGMRLSGQRLMGMRPNGMRPDGMRPKGMRPDGMRLKGTWLIGMRPNRMTPNITDAADVEPCIVVSRHPQSCCLLVPFLQPVKFQDHITFCLFASHTNQESDLLVLSTVTIDQ